MQIVIDIPEEMYNWYDNGFPEEDDAEKLWKIVKNGTPLSSTESSTGSSTDNCISQEAVIEILSNYGCTNKEGLLFKDIRELPSVKPKVDVEVLIKKIERELASSMYDDWGNYTCLHDGLVDIIREWVESEKEE